MTAPGNASIDARRMGKLLRGMIDIYSPSGKEQELLAYLHAFLKRQHLPVSRQELEDGRCNLIVAPPPGGEIELALIGHVDTVSAYDLDQYGYSQKDDRISGLGAADMKSGCAALIEAYLSAWQAGADRLQTALVLVVGEEQTGDGAARLLEEYHFPWALIAEPTQLAVCPAHYGYIEIQLTTRGQRRHASLANSLANPVESMLQALLALTRHMSGQRPEGVCNIRDLLTSQSGFAVPDWCEAWLDLHWPPHTNTAEICVEIEEVIQNSLTGPAHQLADVRFHTIQGGYDLPQKGALIQALQEIYRNRRLSWQPTAFLSHSDANLLWANGIKPVLLGPGSLAKSHVPDESVAWPEVITAAEIYSDLIVKYYCPYR
jgi:acetylornithine deacetylase